MILRRLYWFETNGQQRPLPSAPVRAGAGAGAGAGQSGPSVPVPVVVDVALPSTQSGLPDHFFFLPAGRQSGTVRLLSLHHFALIDTRSGGGGGGGRIRSTVHCDRGVQPAEPCPVDHSSGAVWEHQATERRHRRRASAAPV